MAELINKDTLLEKIGQLQVSDDYWKDIAKIYETIKDAPIVTESEIRAKAIERFMKEIEAEYENDACPNVTDYLDYKISLRNLFRIADELKGGAY